VHKVYEAVAPWRQALQQPRTVTSRLRERPGEAFMQVEEVPGPPNAITSSCRWWRAAASGRCTASSAHGREAPAARPHELALGAPILGDRIYPVLWPHPAPDAPPDWSQPLQAARARAAPSPTR
jgi:tRNA pseudouridine32 synthase/23S rRNA pseudouridine746 synthase